MATSMLDLFRVLSSFSPTRVDLKAAPWDAYVEWAIAQGLAPLAAYNLEYRLGLCGAPQWAKDRLLSLYQGTANDNVMKLVNFKRAVDDLEGRRIVLLGAASFAESLYPHVAFRPVIDVRLFVPPGDVDPFVSWLRRAEFKADTTEAPAPSGERALSDGRTMLYVHGALAKERALDDAMLSRCLPIRFYGPSMYRLDLEDALLVHVMLMARAGFDVPMLEFIDLRELVQGAPSMGGDYSRAPRPELVLARAEQLGVERALWAALGVVEKLFPETGEAVAKLRPSLLLPTREVLERLVVAPLAQVGRMEAFRGEDTLRQLLAGG
ncbi:MAG: nucleotidyltransferase family protein [Myxococcaceae bacterium]|nr:nucleotidyltransferase family protein [Myxococcaceae bacterium]